MCDPVVGVVGEIFGPDATSGRIWRFIFWLAMAAIFFGSLYWAIQSGAFSES